MEQTTHENPAEEAAVTQLAPGTLEISSTAVMQESRAEHEMGFHRRLLLAQQNLILTAMVNERDQRIEQLAKDITDRDNHSVAADRDLDTKVARIAELEAHLSDRDTRIASLQRDLEAKDTAIRALEADLDKVRPARKAERSN